MYFIYHNYHRYNERTYTLRYTYTNYYSNIFMHTYLLNLASVSGTKIINHNHKVLHNIRELINN